MPNNKWKWLPFDDAGLAVIIMVLVTLTGFGHYVATFFYYCAGFIAFFLFAIYLLACLEYQNRKP